MNEKEEEHAPTQSYKPQNSLRKIFSPSWCNVVIACIHELHIFVFQIISIFFSLCLFVSTLTLHVELLLFEHFLLKWKTPWITVWIGLSDGFSNSFFQPFSKASFLYWGRSELNPVFSFLVGVLRGFSSVLPIISLSCLDLVIEFLSVDYCPFDFFRGG